MKNLKLILFILFLIYFCLYDWWILQEFDCGYQDGYNCAQDSFENPEDRTEGFYDYWLGSSFWFQQGYEEGYKRGGRDYVKENSNTNNN